MSVSGFEWQRLNRVALSALQQPVNQAVDYGVSVVKASAGPAWRCIGIFKLAPEQNRGRHNVFIDVLDEQGNRDRQPLVNWTWYMDAPMQTVRLDKPDNEPAADIPVEKSYTVTLRVNGGGLASDSVGGIHTRHRDEGEGNTYGHHSFYIVFQRQGSGIITPPVDPVDPPTDTNLAQRVATLEEQMRQTAALLQQQAALLVEWSGGK